MGQRQGLPAKGTLPQQVSCALQQLAKAWKGQPLPQRLLEAVSLGVQVDIVQDLVGAAAGSQAGLDKPFLRWHLEDTVHLQPGPGHFLLAWAVGAL